MFQFPTTWQALESLLNDGVLQNLSDEFKRSLFMRQQYAQDRSKLFHEHAISDLKAEIAQAKVSISPTQNVALTANRYPYDLLLQHLPDVQHQLLWFEGELSPNEAIAVLHR